MFLKIKFKTYVFLYYFYCSALNYNEKIIENPFLLDKSIMEKRKDFIKDSIDDYIFMTNKELKLEDSLRGRSTSNQRDELYNDCILKRY